MTQQKKDKGNAELAEVKRQAEEAGQRTLVNIVLPSPKPETTDGALSDEDKNRLRSIENYNSQILKAYKDKYGKEAEQNTNGNYLLPFESLEEATQFFEDQAKNEKVAFFAAVVNADGELTGDYFMSYGDGKFHQGNVEPKEIDALFQKFLDKMSKPKEQATIKYKDELTNQKNESSESPSPTPFNTDIPTPKPGDGK